MGRLLWLNLATFLVEICFCNRDHCRRGRPLTPRLVLGEVFSFVDWKSGASDFLVNHSSPHLGLRQPLRHRRASTYLNTFSDGQLLAK